MSQSINCDYIIDTETNFLNGATHQAGDTFCIQAGYRGPLYIGNMAGNTDSALVFINYGGVCDIESDLGYGISISNCQYIKLLGIGSEDEYGIKISSVPSGSGIKAGMLTSDLEIAYLEISDTKYSGITAKSDPTCSFNSVRDSFTMYNTHLHHNYIHDVGTEGMYVGNSFYTGVTLDDCDTTVLPHVLDGVNIHHNIIEYSGWDGIQLGCALYNSKIHHNTINYDSQEERVYQMSGIMVNPGSACDVYNNTIMNGKGTGISLQGVGNQKIYNNLIVNSGRGYLENDQTTAQKFGIFCKYVINENIDSTFLIANNTIINPKSDGIRFQNLHTSTTQFFNNIIINPGAFDYYETNGNTSNTGYDSYLHIYYDNIEFEESNNIYMRNSAEMNFSDTTNYQYQLTNSSPAVDEGINLSSSDILFDIDDLERPFGEGFDIGAYEYQQTSIIQNNFFNQLDVYPNPTQDRIKISMKDNDAIKDLKLMDQHGNTIFGVDSLKDEYLSISNLKKGVYLLKIETKNEKIYTQKILKL